MANYTMTVNDCLNNPLTPMFNFDYPFYVEDEQAKSEFEEKFIMYYLNKEIGFETFARFENALKSRLIIKMPYYKQLYETELASKDINFLLNKDLTETTTRELTGVESGTGNKETTNGENQTLSSSTSTTGETSATNKSTNTGESTSSGKTTTNNKTSQLSDGVSSASLETGYLTGVSQDEQSTTGTQQIESTTNDTQNSTENVTVTQEGTNTRTNTVSEEETNRRENSQSETITLTSQGNIGVTSSAHLLQKWRDVLINMDEMIIKDCRDLFMQIY